MLLTTTSTSSTSLPVVTPDRLRQFGRDFLARLHVECFVHGNADRARALELTGLVEQQLHATVAMQLPLLSRQLLLKREYRLQAGERYLFETHNEFHKSSCAELYVQCGRQSDRANVMVDLVAQVLTEPCYNQLRTKEQLGYIVFCGPRKANGVQGIRVIVQSTRHPADVEERIECFLDSMEVSGGTLRIWWCLGSFDGIYNIANSIFPILLVLCKNNPISYFYSLSYLSYLLHTLFLHFVIKL